MTTPGPSAGGITASTPPCSPLPSERDQNFLLTTASRRAARPEDLERRGGPARDRSAERGARCTWPRWRRTSGFRVCGMPPTARPWCRVRRRGGHAAPGEAAHVGAGRDAGPRANRTRRSCCAASAPLLGAVDAALETFAHPAAERDLKWDPRRAGWIREYFAHVEDPARRTLVERLFAWSERGTLAPRARPAAPASSTTTPTTTTCSSTAPTRTRGA